MLSILKPKHIALIALLALTGVTMAACGSSAEKLNREGNEAFAKQAYEKALAAYQTAQIEAPELAEPYYNAANSLYRQEKYQEALEQMQKALSYAHGEELAQNSHFNMGNTAYNTQEWESAVESYRQALLLDPDDPDAKYNLELALKQQQEQQEKQEQQQEQSEDGESQEGEQDQSQENEPQQEQEQSQQGDDQQEQDQQQEGDQSQTFDQQNEPDQSQDDGTQQDQEPQKGEGQSGQDQSQDDPSQPNQVPPPGQRMTEDQARQLLEAIARDSDTLQERLGQYYLVPMGPPVQDW